MLIIWSRFMLLTAHAPVLLHWTRATLGGGGGTPAAVQQYYTPIPRPRRGR